MVWILKMREFAVICTALLLFCGCDKKDDEQSRTSTPSASPAMNESATPPAQNNPGMDLAKAEAETRKKLMEMNEGKVIKPIALDKLKSFLPADVPDMECKSTSVERNQMMGIDMAIAEARFEGDDSATIDVSITDVGNLSGPMKMSFTGWTMRQYEEQTDTGYEKTTKYNGYPAMEEYDRDAEQGAFRIFVASRFIVDVEGYQTTMEKIKQTIDKIDVKKLAALASD